MFSKKAKTGISVTFSKRGAEKILSFNLLTGALAADNTVHIAVITAIYMSQQKTQGYLSSHNKVMMNEMGRSRRVVGSIWDIGAGNQSSRPVQNANSRIPLDWLTLIR